MNPIYKIVKGLLDLCRQVKNIKVSPKTKIALEKYGKRIDWENIRVLPILTAFVGLSIVILIGITIFKTVADNMNPGLNVTGVSAISSGGGMVTVFGFFFLIMVIAIAYAAIKIMSD